MAISMHEAAVPVLVRMLRNLDAILGKAAAHAEAQKIDPAVLIGARLYPDMLPLSRQVQIATDHAKGCAARLAGMEVPKYADDETTFPQLSDRIRKTLAFIEGLEPEQLEGAEKRSIHLDLRSGPLDFDGLTYLTAYGLPNFFFHVTTAYDILRHNGVELGKRDFIGGR